MRFYRKVFDWEFDRWNGLMDYGMITTGPPESPGIDGGHARREGPVPDDETPTPTYTCTIDVDDVERVVESVTENGGRIDGEIRAIPGVGRLAYCRHTEGNRFGVMESDESAD